MRGCGHQVLVNDVGEGRELLVTCLTPGLCQLTRSAPTKEKNRIRAGMYGGYQGSTSVAR